MSNAFFTAVSLDDQAGHATNSSQNLVQGLCIKSALIGSLTITGVCNANGSPAAWVVPATTQGFVSPPGSARCATLSFAYASASDMGKAIAILQTL